MDLTKFTFPANNENTNPELLKEAERRGYSINNCPKFDKIFYSGGIIIYKEDIDEDYKKRVIGYLNGFMRSWSPSHEDKSAISEMLLDEIVEKIN